MGVGSGIGLGLLGIMAETLSGRGVAVQSDVDGNRFGMSTSIAGEAGVTLGVISEISIFAESGERLSPSRNSFEDMSTSSSIFTRFLLLRFPGDGDTLLLRSSSDPESVVDQSLMHLSSPFLRRFLPVGDRDLDLSGVLALEGSRSC